MIIKKYFWLNQTNNKLNSIIFIFKVFDLNKNLIKANYQFLTLNKVYNKIFI